MNLPVVALTTIKPAATTIGRVLNKHNYEWCQIWQNGLFLKIQSHNYSKLRSITLTITSEYHYQLKLVVSTVHCYVTFIGAIASYLQVQLEYGACIDITNNNLQVLRSMLDSCTYNALKVLADDLQWSCAATASWRLN